jgi:hypothetical protein
VIDCTGEGNHQPLKREWFDTLDRLASMKRRGAKTSTNDWALLSTATLALNDKLRSEKDYCTVKVFVALMQEEYRKHLRNCSHECYHMASEPSIELSKKPSSLVQDVQRARLASESLQELFSNADGILGDIVNWRLDRQEEWEEHWIRKSQG